MSRNLAKTSISVDYKEINISINQLPNLKESHLHSNWKNYIEVEDINYIQPLNKYNSNDLSESPSLNKWVIYNYNEYYINFSEYVRMKGSIIKLPILKKYVRYYNSHYSYIEGLF